MGSVQEQTENELREAEPRPALLLPQEHHPQNSRQALCVPIRLRCAGYAWEKRSGSSGQHEHLAGERRLTDTNKVRGAGGRLAALAHLASKRRRSKICPRSNTSALTSSGSELHHMSTCSTRG